MRGKRSGDSVQDGKAAAVPRRVLLSVAGLGALLIPPLVRATAGHAAAAARAEIPQPAVPSDSAFIQRAFEMRDLAVAYGDQGYGAVVVRDGLIVGQAWSRVILDRDPTGHAEMAAIRDAAARLNSRSLGGAILYSSSRPCPMCEAAAYWAGIAEMIHGEAAARAGRPRLCR